MSEGFTNAVVGGAETLIRTAIKSFGFITGVFGWRLERNGSAEFNDATVRGSISAGGGTVLLDAGGLHIEGSGEQYDINFNAGFLARNDPADGEQTQITPQGIFLTPVDPSPGGTAVDFASISVDYNNAGAADESPFLMINGVEYTGKSAPTIIMHGQAANDANPDSSTHLQISNAQSVSIPHRLVSSNTGMDYPAAQLFEDTLDILTADTTKTSPLRNWPTAFPPGSTIFAFVNYERVASGIGNLPFWSARMKQVTDTQYQFYAYSNNVAAGANQTMTVQIAAFVVPG